MLSGRAGCGNGSFPPTARVYLSNGEFVGAGHHHRLPAFPTGIWFNGSRN